MEALVTKYQSEKLAREQAIFEEYNRLISAGCMISAAHQQIREKFNIAGNYTTYAILKRVRERLNA